MNVKKGATTAHVRVDIGGGLEQGRAIADDMIDRDKTRAAGTGNDVAQ